MKKNLFKGSLFTVGASLWWGVIGVLYFKFVSFASALELAIHRTIWTALLLLITTTYFSKWKEFNNIIKKKINKKWTTRDKEIQYIKRGRYTEFNLLYDRGTKFGLQTGGNVDGILMSLPPLAKWT